MSFLNGPDQVNFILRYLIDSSHKVRLLILQIIPGSENYTTWTPDGCVKLRDLDSASSVPPLSVPTLLKNAAETASKDSVALAVKRNGEWIKWNYQQYYDVSQQINFKNELSSNYSKIFQEARTVAKGFIKLGLERFHSVGILGFNAPEWFIAQAGAIFAGGFSSGIYTTNSAEACKYIAENCRANILIVEDEKQLEKILQIKDELPHLKKIVQYIGKPDKEVTLD